MLFSNYSATGGWLNPPLRFPDEPCRHKVLDLIGDISLFAKAGSQGLPVAHIISYKVYIYFFPYMMGTSCPNLSVSLIYCTLYGREDMHYTLVLFVI